MIVGMFLWLYPCGHSRRLHPFERFPVREGCMRCHLERKAAEKDVARKRRLRREAA